MELKNQFQRYYTIFPLYLFFLMVPGPMSDCMLQGPVMQIFMIKLFQFHRYFELKKRYGLEIINLIDSLINEKHSSPGMWLI